MKKTFALFTLLLTISFFTACSNAPKGDKVEAKDAVAETAKTATEGTKYAVNTTESKILWTGTKPGGQHTGTINLSNGTISVVNGAITGGEFTIDFNSLAVTDLEGEKKGQLEGHLKDGDFFEVEAHPKGSFVITNVAAVAGDPMVTHNVTGNLTMKGISKSVTIPTNVAVLGDKIMATSKAFTVDRTQWGITFHSSSVNTVADKVINDEVGLVVKLVANK